MGRLRSARGHLPFVGSAVAVTRQLGLHKVLERLLRRATVRRGSSPNSSPRRREGHPHAWEVNWSKLRPGDDGVSARDSR